MNTCRNQRRYTNAALTVIAGLLGLNALSSSDLLAPSAAHAQSGEDGLVSAAEQRKVMIAELRNLSSRIERLETTIARGVNVKVTDMPAVRLADPSQMSDARESRESRDARDTRKSK
jgi:hypothetical protein